MKKFNIPYSTGFMELSIEESRITGILSPESAIERASSEQENKQAEGPKAEQLNEEADLVRAALENPISYDRLKDLVKDADKVLLITSDHTRPVPSKITLPVLLQEIRSCNPNVKIKILIATGFHRLTTHSEMINKFGEGIVENEDLINHDSRDMTNMVYKGLLPSGGELWLNSLVDWADVVVSEGFIEPHFFAGFSGGRKSILPGIASQKTVLANHCSKFIAHSNARAGILEGNPIHQDMVYAAKQAGLRFIMNVIIDDEKRIIKAFAGHPEEAHIAGCEYATRHSAVKAAAADIVVTSNGGYPLDQNIYQAVKGMTAAEACVRDGGVIIMVAACNDGHGGEEFYRWFKDAASPMEVADKIAKIPQDKTIADQWEAQILARVLLKATVILVTDKCDSQMIIDMHMKHAPDMETAMAMAEKIAGEQASVTIIPNGVSVIVR